jgi:hypothetical protein
MRGVVSLTERIKWGASRVSRSAARVQLADVLSPGDLPGIGWRVIDERAWRTGTSGAQAAWASRARASGLLTAWRSFEQGSAQRWLWIQVTPLVDDRDAEEALHAVPERLLANLRSKVEVMTSIDLEAVAIDGSSAGWAHEQHTNGRRGDGIALYSAFATGSKLVALAASGLKGSWSWAEVARVSQRQADRLGSK